MKFLHRFCATEIRILLKKIEEDYDSMRDNSVWYHLLQNQRHMTRIEKFCVNRAGKKARKTHERNKYLAAIISQQLNPKDYDLAVDGFVDTAKYNLTATQQQLYNQSIAAQQAHAMKNAMVTGNGIVRITPTKL